MTTHKLVPCEPTPDTLHRMADAMAKAFKDANLDPTELKGWIGTFRLAQAAYSAMLESAPEVSGDAVEPRYYSNDEGDSWYDFPDDVDFLSDFDPLEIGTEYELDVAYRNAKRRYKVTKIPDENSDDYEVELVSHKGPVYYTEPQPDRTAQLEARIAELELNDKRYKALKTTLQPVRITPLNRSALEFGFDDIRAKWQIQKTLLAVSCVGEHIDFDDAIDALIADMEEKG